MVAIFGKSYPIYWIIELGLKIVYTLIFRGNVIKIPRKRRRKQGAVDFQCLVLRGKRRGRKKRSEKGRGKGKKNEKRREKKKGRRKEKRRRKKGIASRKRRKKKRRKRSEKNRER